MLSWRRPLGWLVAGVVAVLVREVTRSPGSMEWPVQVQGSPDTGNHGSGHWILDILNITPCEAVVWTAVQECLAPLQPPVLHSLLLEAGSDKATHHGYTSALYTYKRVAVGRKYPCTRPL